MLQFADGENSNVALENAGGEWLTIYGTQDIVQMWKDQIDDCIRNRAALNVRLKTASIDSSSLFFENGVFRPHVTRCFPLDFGTDLFVRPPSLF